MRFLLASFSLLFSSLVFANSVNNIVVFGDSLSDNGNLYEYMQHKLPQSPPYYQGRFTNGLTWVEDLAAFYFPKDSKSHLLDYAFGGAAVLADEEEEEDSALFTFKREIDSYLLGHHGKAAENSLFIVWMGSNNFLSLAINDDHEKSLSQVNKGITQGLKRLVAAGAKTIVVFNLPDLGATPYARELGLQQHMSFLSQRHNALLQTSVDKLSKVYPHVQWLYFDAKELLNDLVMSPGTYGLKNVTDTCYCTTVNKTSRPSVLRMVANVKPFLHQQDSCEGYLFFDPLHPTEIAHRLMAQRARSFLDRAGIKFVS